MTVLILAMALIGCRMAWQRRPSFWSCAVFWAVVVCHRVIVMTTAHKPHQVALEAMFCAGFMCNAAVTLANNGRMPVRRRGLTAPFTGRSIWVRRCARHRLAWLGDNYPLFSFGRYSIGDAFIFAGLLAALVFGA